MSGNQSYVGQREANSGAGLYNLMSFVFETLLGRVATATVVQVKAVHPGDGLRQGTVDAQLLVNQVDSLGNATPHGVVYGLPYARVQSGSRALIIDPQVGDIGVAVFASRDISSAMSPTNVEKLASGAVSTVNPGSFRRYDYADGIYLLSVGGATAPADYLELPAEGGLAYSDRFGNSIAGGADGVTINGVLISRGGVSFDLKTHTHHQANDSRGDVEQPTDGPTDGS